MRFSCIGPKYSNLYYISNALYEYWKQTPKQTNKQTKKQTKNKQQIKGTDQTILKGVVRFLNKPTIAVGFKRQSGEGKFNSQVSSKPS